MWKLKFFSGGGVEKLVNTNLNGKNRGVGVQNTAYRGGGTPNCHRGDGG